MAKSKPIHSFPQYFPKHYVSLDVFFSVNRSGVLNLWLLSFSHFLYISNANSTSTVHQYFIPTFPFVVHFLYGRAS